MEYEMAKRKKRTNAEIQHQLEVMTKDVTTLYPAWLLQTIAYENWQQTLLRILGVMILAQLGCVGFLLWKFSMTLVWTIVLNSLILVGIIQGHHYLGTRVAEILDENLDNLERDHHASR